MANILLVDDSLTVRSLLTSVLETAGHAITHAEDGEQGLSVIDKAAPFELIITDLIMPTMNGITFITALRTLPAYVNTPILVLTTEYAQEKRREADVAGANAWAVKPFCPGQLLETVQQLLTTDFSERR